MKTWNGGFWSILLGALVAASAQTDTLDVRNCPGQGAPDSITSLPIASGTTAHRVDSLTVADPTVTFRPLAGTYTGLFLQTNTPTHASSGVIQIVLAKTGAYAGNLTLGSVKTAFKGRFDLAGNATNSVFGAGVALHLDVAGGSGPMTGTVTGRYFTSVVLAELPGPSQVRKGTYTLVLSPADATVTNVPQGYGYATVAVSRTGSASLRGVLNDGTSVKANAPVSQSGLWPLYVSLYHNVGACIGWVSFESNTTVTAAVDWFAPRSKAYAGFTTTLLLDGTKYTTGPQPLSGAWAVTLSGGGLVSNIVNAVNLTAAGKVTVTHPGPDALTLKLTVKTGQLTGSFKVGARGKAIPFDGLLLQIPGAGAGLFKTTTGQTGGITLEPVR